MMKDFCTDCSDTIDSCTCDDFDTEIQSLKLENENLQREMNKMSEFKEIILSANQTLTDHIKKQEQEIENLKYKNNFLAECALEDQKKLQDKIKQLETNTFAKQRLGKENHISKHLTQKANLHNFMRELAELTNKYRLAIYGCGCCDALYSLDDDDFFLATIKFNEETKTYEF